MSPREAGLLFATACRRIAWTARTRDELEARVAVARYACGAPADLGTQQIEGWWLLERRRWAKNSILLFRRLRDRHRVPAAMKKQLRKFKRAGYTTHTY